MEGADLSTKEGLSGSFGLCLDCVCLLGGLTGGGDSGGLLLLIASLLTVTCVLGGRSCGTHSSN